MPYNARDLWNQSVDDIWNLPEGEIQIEFDDGIIAANNRSTIFSYYLGVYHRAYPNTPLLQSHHIQNEVFTKSTTLKYLQRCLWSCADAYGDQVDMEVLSKMAYDAINHIYNDFTSRLKAYVSTISILDFIEVAKHPEMVEIDKGIQPTELSIETAYDKKTAILKRKGEFVGNTVSRMVKSNLVPLTQVLQVIGPRGYVYDIDSTVFTKPVMTGYLQGLNTLHDNLTESRGASISLMSSKDMVKDSEYFNRELQLMCSIVSRIHPGDCGTKGFIPFKVKAGDIEKLAGKYYINDDGSLSEIKLSDTHMESKGHLLQLRSPLKCEHPDRYGVCSTCYGAIARGIPKGTNVGNLAAAILCEIISQTLLSLKHLIGSSKLTPFTVLSDYHKKFLRTTTDPRILKLTQELSGKNVKLTIMPSEASRLSDIDHTDDVNKLPPESISELTQVGLTIEDESGEKTTVLLPVSMGSRKSSLTIQALAFLKKYGWKLSTEGNYVIDLSKWVVEDPLFQLPNKNEDMGTYMKNIKSFIMSSKDSKKKEKILDNRTLSDFPTVESALSEFYRRISAKMSVNIVHLEIILMACMATSEETKDIGIPNDLARDHRVPKPPSTGVISSYNSNMMFRSFGTSMAYQGQSKKLIDFVSFRVPIRPDSPYDTILKPFPFYNPRQ